MLSIIPIGHFCFAASGPTPQLYLYWLVWEF